MTPIINPWIFYFADIANSLKEVNIAFALVSGVGFILITGLIVISYGEDVFDKETLFTIIKWNKIICLIFIITLLIAIFCPCQETIYKMAIASIITEENINKTTDEIKELIDYTVDKIDNMEEDE